jgi:hypothetical protein
LRDKEHFARHEDVIYQIALLRDPDGPFQAQDGLPAALAARVPGLILAERNLQP